MDLSNVLSEENVLKILGVSEEALASLRKNGKLPFCRITRTKRLYLEQDVIDFIVGQKVSE